MNISISYPIIVFEGITHRPSPLKEEIQALGMISLKTGEEVYIENFGNPSKAQPIINHFFGTEPHKVVSYNFEPFFYTMELEFPPLFPLLDLSTMGYEWLLKYGKLPSEISEKIPLVQMLNLFNLEVPEGSSEIQIQTKSAAILAIHLLSL